jgi:hypothetical protein
LASIDLHSEFVSFCARIDLTVCFNTMKRLSMIFAVQCALWLIRAESIDRVALEISWPAFLARSDPVWRFNASDAKTMPEAWYESAFTGNGLLGVMVMTQNNALRFSLGRSDLWDVRMPGSVYAIGNAEFDRCQLPAGHFVLEVNDTDGSPSSISFGQMRTNLANASITGSLATSSAGNLSFRVFVHARRHLFEISLKGEAAQSGKISLRFVPEPAVPQAAGRSPPKGYVQNPSAECGEGYCVQKLSAGGSFATAWSSFAVNTDEVHYIATVTNDVPANSRRRDGDAIEIARRLLDNATKVGRAGRAHEHNSWWHDLYSNSSFLSFSNMRAESFYWQQIHKLAAATRCMEVGGSGMLDGEPNCWPYNLMGPWYTPSRWDDYHWDLNVQMAHWPVLPTNLLNIGESLIVLLENQMASLINNVGTLLRNDSASIPANTGWDLAVTCTSFVTDCASLPDGKPIVAPPKAQLGNLAWVAHNVWLQYRYSMDKNILQKVGWELIRRSANFYLRNAVISSDGTFHTPPSESPEYGNVPLDANYDLSLWKWSLQTAIHITEDILPGIAMPLELAGWRNALKRLASYPRGKGGWAIGANVSLAHMHRHWSHLFMIYPLHLERWSTSDAVMRSLIASSTKWYAHFRPPNGFSKVAVAGLYSAIPDQSAVAWASLEDVLRLYNISPNAQYWESSHAPCNESPLGWAFQLTQLFLRSWDAGVLEVFPNAPLALPDIDFYNLRTEGAFLVSASRRNATTRFVSIKSLSGAPLDLRVDSSMPPPWEYEASPGVVVAPSADHSGAFKVTGINANQSIVLWSQAHGRPMDGMVVSMISADPSTWNSWGKHPTNSAQISPARHAPSWQYV